MDRDACRTALSSYDILWHILSPYYISGRTYGIPTPKYYVNEKDMAQCARVSRAFFGPAVRLLWAQLRSLWPLWSLLAPATLSDPESLSAVSPLGSLHRHTDIHARAIFYTLRNRSMKLSSGRTQFDGTASSTTRGSFAR